MVVTCPYCQQPAECVRGTEIYPYRRDLHGRWYWRCLKDDAWVGCHKKDGQHFKVDGIPLGRLANAELRAAKQAAHAALDPLFAGRQMTRRAVYRWLSEQMGLPKAKTHIGWFSIAQCEEVVRLVKARA